MYNNALSPIPKVEAAGTWQECLVCSLWQLPISYSVSFIWPTEKNPLCPQAGTSALPYPYPPG